MDKICNASVPLKVETINRSNFKENNENSKCPIRKKKSIEMNNTTSAKNPIMPLKKKIKIRKNTVVHVNKTK